MKSKYEAIFIKLYNEGVKHDEQVGHLDSEWNRTLAKRWASINLHHNSVDKFMAEWDEFYYHMFD